MSQDVSVATPVDATSTPPLPDITTALAWRDWATGLAEAGRRRVPILALAEAPWANGAQRLGFVFERDAELRELLEEVFVPILVDPCARPDLVSRWQWASIVMAGTSGPPLLLLLTHEGLPFLSYCSMWPEGRAPHPSLAALARATFDAYSRDPEPFLAEARALDSPTARGMASAYGSAGELWQALAGETDALYGGMREVPKHPHPQLLLTLIDGEDAGPEAGGFVRTTLGAMVRGGINDQVAEGFHRCSRDERWIVPHFEKPVPLNAQLAAVYARAARVFADDALHAEANALAAFCLAMVRDGADAVASDGHYYTWTAREMRSSLDPALLQAVSLHVNMTPDRSRQVLYRARNPHVVAEYSVEDPETLRQRIVVGKRQMRVVRDRRRLPEPIRLAAPSWPAQTLRWLFFAAEQGCDLPVEELTEHLHRLIADGCDERIGYPRPGDGDIQGWLEDQAAILAAMLAAHRATRDDVWLERARTLADVILEHYGQDGGWLDGTRERDTPELSRAITDDVLPSPIATVTAALSELGALLGDDRFTNRARIGAAAHLPGPNSGPWAAALWRAWFEVA